MQKGYSGGLLLANSQQGKVLALSLWESEQDNTTDEASRWFRLFGAEAAEYGHRRRDLRSLHRTTGSSTTLQRGAEGLTFRTPRWSARSSLRLRIVSTAACRLSVSQGLGKLKLKC